MGVLGSIGKKWSRFNERPDDETPIEWCFRAMTLLPRTLSLSPLPHSPATHQDLQRIDYYVLAWVPIVIVLSLPATLGYRTLTYLACAVAFYRWAEILATQLGILLVSTRVQHSPTRMVVPIRGSAQRGLELGLVNLLQLIIAFSVMSQGVTAANKHSYQPMPGSWFDHLYMSWTNVLTLGNGYASQSVLARLLVMAEVGSGLLMIGITLAAILGRFGETNSPNAPF